MSPILCTIVFLTPIQEYPHVMPINSGPDAVVPLNEFLQQQILCTTELHQELSYIHFSIILAMISYVKIQINQSICNIKILGDVFI